jgi:DNA-binding CsgD family transcriptional regulator
MGQQTPGVVREHGWLPAHLRIPLLAAQAAADPAQALMPLLNRLGFTGLSYFGPAGAHGAAGLPQLLWSSAGADWVRHYRQHGYATCDPRLTEPRGVTPFLWDRARCIGVHHMRRFLDDARLVHACSGVVVSLRAAPDLRAVVAFDSAQTPLTAAFIDRALENLGNLMLLAGALHEDVFAPRFAHRLPRRALTERECDCLGFAAHGLTSADIGSKLGITERTVNFHVGNAIRKLGALNRPEAIAKGIARGLVRAE